MKTMLHSLVAVVCLAGLSARAQSSAFTYQGRLNDSGQPATGVYDLRFSLYDALSGGTVRGGPVNKPATPVTNGLFMITLDFGAGTFDGADRWLEIAAGTNGAPVLTPLSPRQPLTATPYAVRAASARTAATAAIASTVAANSVGASALQSGAVDSARIADNSIGIADLSPTVRSNVFWRLDGNAGTTAGTHFLGTTDIRVTEPAPAGRKFYRLRQP
jgi:hypothetical protein